MGETRAWGVRARGLGCAGGFLRALASARAGPPRSPRPSCARLCRQCRNERAQATQRGTRARRDVVRSWLRRELGMRPWLAEGAGVRSWLRRELGVRWHLRGARAPLRGHASLRLLARLCPFVSQPRSPRPTCARLSRQCRNERAQATQRGTRAGRDVVCDGRDVVRRRTRRGVRRVRRVRRGAAPTRRARRGTAGAARRRLSAPGELLDASQRVPRRACQASRALYPGDRTGL